MITLVILILFRSLKTALLSLIPNVLPLLAMFGIMGLFRLPLDTTTVMVGPIVLGIAVDDTIHFISRYRRELQAGTAPRDAISMTIKSTGRALVSTSFILAAGFFVTLFSTFRPQTIWGGLGSATILMALAADLILLPAVILIFMKQDKGKN
jgi:hypothetical protein